MDLLSKEALLPRELPEFGGILHEAKKTASGITIGKTLFMEKYDVSSEAEYKQRRMNECKVMRHAQIGWNSWQETAKGFLHIYGELNHRGILLDRFGISLDWIMGVPEVLRHKVNRGTGLILSSPEEWKQVGRIVPVQPHFGDHMIGSLNSVENVRLALEAGATTIGNVSHFYTYEYPGLSDQETRVTDTIKALSIMAEFKSSGAIVHSNLDDGFGSQFHDLVNLCGWAMIETYIVENLIGARLSHCFGNLFNDPALRIIFSLVLDDVHHEESIGSMIYGNTIDYTIDYDRNYGALSTFLLGDIIGQVYKPTGHAVSPIPISEASRITTSDEIIQAQVISGIIEDKARDLVSFIDWNRVLEKKETFVENGQKFYERVLNGLDEIGIDIKSPIELMLTLRRIGAAVLEEYFGAGKKDASAIRKRVPVFPTNIVTAISKMQGDLSLKVKQEKNTLTGVKVVLAATDVHEYGKELVSSVLKEAGAKVVDLGTGVIPKEIVETAIETASQFIAISTYNGIALSYAESLLEEIRYYKINATIFMGGLLNENRDGSSLAVDVSEQLRNLGIICCSAADQIIQGIKDRT